MYLPSSLRSSLYSNQYIITEQKVVEREITRPLPRSSWHECVEKGYLKDYAKYYYKSLGYYYLDPDYRDNPPCYTIKVKYTLTYGTLTKECLADLRKRLAIHKKNVDRYEKVLAEAE